MEDSGEEETKFCKNCQRDVSAANFVMHEVHCARNITCCPKCKEPVPRSSLEEHIEENHKLVNCKQCYNEMECCLLEEHMESECSMRDVECEYCELQVKAKDQYEHEDQCGSRTDVCEKCQQYVMLKMMKHHKEYSCGKPAVNRTPRLSPDNSVERGGASVYGGGAGVNGGGAAEAAGLDQSWVDAINACNEDGQTVDVIVAQNLAHENHVLNPAVNNTASDQFTHKAQLNDVEQYYDTSSSSAVEEQKRQFEQFRQLQADEEMAMKLQEQLDAENEFDNPPHMMMPHGDHMMPHDDHMMPDHLPSHMDHMMPHRGRMIPQRDHMMPHSGHTMSDEDNDMADEDHMMPNNDHVMRSDHSLGHMRPHMHPPMGHMMPQMHGLQNDFDNMSINSPPQRIPDEELLPCELCGKGIPPQYLQTHQLQQCPRLHGDNNPFLPSHISGMPTLDPNTKVLDEELLPCEFCGKGFPPEQLEAHQLQQCPRLPDNNAFQPSHVTNGPPPVPNTVTDHEDVTMTTKVTDEDFEFFGQGTPPQYKQTHRMQKHPRLLEQRSHDVDMSPPVPTDVTDCKDLTPGNNGSYSVIKCQYCGARIPSEYYKEHLELCDTANITAPCEHCGQPLLLHQLYDHQALCTHNMMLYGRHKPGMQFPGNPWPSNGKGSVHKRKISSPWLHSKNMPPIRSDPVVMPTRKLSSNSFHSNGDEASFHCDAEATVNHGSTYRLKSSHLTRPPLHSYRPAGAGSVSVRRTGINAMSNPSSQH